MTLNYRGDARWKKHLRTTRLQRHNHHPLSSTNLFYPIEMDPYNFDLYISTRCCQRVDESRIGEFHNSEQKLSILVWRGGSYQLDHKRDILLYLRIYFFGAKVEIQLE